MKRRSLRNLRPVELWRIAMLAIGIASVAPALSERADRGKPINVEADQLSVDEAKQVSVFTGNVTLTQGSLTLRADKLVIKQDSDGFNAATAHGNPARFREKLDGQNEYLEGWAERIEYDGRANKVQFFNSARLKRGQDEVQGNYIAYDGKTEIFQASGAKEGEGRGRVRAIIQPKNQESASSTPTKPAPAGRGS
jgi:lipopolysaccharide export system protein LptA